MLDEMRRQRDVNYRAEKLFEKYLRLRESGGDDAFDQDSLAFLRRYREHVASRQMQETVAVPAN